MGRAFAEQWPAAREYFDAASSACGWDIEALCFDGPAEELTKTEKAQPAIFAVSCICASYALERNVEPDVVAGHSLGEYAALVAAGACEFQRAMAVVCERGRLMARAAEETDGMAAVLGLSIDEVREAIAEVPDVWIANENCPGQTVLSGSKAAIGSAGDRLRDAGAKRVVELAVSGAFHTERMWKANEGLAPLLEELVRRDARVPVVQNATGKATTARSELLSNLKAQMTSPVRWQSSVETMSRLGVATFLELGPGKVLRGLVQRCSPEAFVVCVGEPEDLGEMEGRVASA